MTDTIHLGFEVGSGNPVEVPLKHMAVTGQTQESGKTTTLEALVSRLEPGTAALTFITKRGESAFQGGDALGVRQEVRPYFRDRADWQFVDSLLAAQLQEKNKFLRPWIMRICRTTRTLAEVHRKVREALKTAKGIHEGVYTQLDAYLDLIVPEIGRANLETSLEILPGLNVMDISGFATPMQMLFVQSALDVVNADCTSTIVVIPEAWEMVPEGKGSPVKASAVSLVRKGASVGNRIWVDSQDMAGVDKVILRGCTVWLIGVQREANEIKRNLSNIPHGTAKPSAAQVALLERGQFYACWGTHCIRTYVQPAWMDEGTARGVARGDIAMVPNRKAVGFHSGKLAILAEESFGGGFVTQEEAEVKESEARELRDDNERLRLRIEELELTLKAKLGSRKLRDEHTDAPDSEPAAASHLLNGNEEALYQRFRDRLSKEAPKLLKVLLTKQELEVQVERQTITAKGDSLRGRTARLIAKGFFDEGVSGSAVQKELARLGKDPGPANMYKELDNLAEMEFLTVEGTKPRLYRAAADMKVNIVDGR